MRILSPCRVIGHQCFCIALTGRLYRVTTVGLQHFPQRGLSEAVGWPASLQMARPGGYTTAS